MTLKKEKVTAMIINIAIESLQPHPRNPRIELGDLSELAESIKAQGVLQNLVVVLDGQASEGHPYTVVVGHRRLAAAKLAGLEYLPCAVSEMGEMEQIAAMLTENVQRSSLTLAEEAVGIQMMLDLGESVEGVSSRIGLSKSKVRRSAKAYTEFGIEALMRVQDRPIKLDDYEKLYKISDTTKRAEVFEKIGTSDFDWECAVAISEQERKECKALILGELESFAQEVPYRDIQSTSIKDRWDFYKRDSEEVDAAKELAASHEADVDHFYVQSPHGSITVFTKDETSPATPENDWAVPGEIGEGQAALRDAALRDALEAAYGLRLNFARGFNGTRRRIASAIIRMSVDALFYSGHLDEGVFSDLIGLEEGFRKHWENADAGETKEEAAAKYISGKDEDLWGCMFAGAYCRLERKSTLYVGRAYSPDKDLELLYKHLEALGYCTSSEEKALLDGTHELYGVAPSECPSFSER